MAVFTISGEIMSSKAIDIVKRSKSNIVYVGDSRRESINAHAVKVTSKSGVPVQPGDFLQFLIDSFSDEAEIEMIRQLNNRGK